MPSLGWRWPSVEAILVGTPYDVPGGSPEEPCTHGPRIPDADARLVVGARTGRSAVFFSSELRVVISGRRTGPANVGFHEFGTDYALGVREDRETEVKSVVLYSLRRQ